VILMTPPLLQKQFHLDATTSLLANCVATLCLTVGCVSAGALSDRFGARRVLAIGGIALAISYYVLFRQIAVDSAMLMPLYALAGLLVGTIGAVPYVMVNAFPPVVRFSGISFSYNVAYAVFGGLTPIVVALLMKSEPLAPTYYVAAICVLGAVTTLFFKDPQRED